MKLSQHNIFSQIRDSEKYFIVNLLNGNADILEPGEVQMLNDLIAGKEVPDPFLTHLETNGYVVNELQEETQYRHKYFDFTDSRDSDEIQLFFVPNYTCNFACTYCYQDEYIRSENDMNQHVSDAFFNYIGNEFAGRKKYITLFGGEPLLNSSKQKNTVTYFLEKAKSLDMDVCIVTNGYTLEEYAGILQKGRIREIQVTLDGVGDIHDKRRFLHGGGATFEKTVKGIETCLSMNIPVNLRVVLDKENISGLPGLAQFAIDKGWTNNPLFKTQLGRNYELHHCQAASEVLFSRISLYEMIYEMIKVHPHIIQFHKPAFSIAKFLAENRDLPGQLFDDCPACKTEWAFDYTGQIYSCTATVGKTGESLGTFYPQVKRNKEMIRLWEQRDVTSISECRNCNLQLACGGGCGSVAKNKSGRIGSPDCRPVKELLELGFATYFQDELLNKR